MFDDVLHKLQELENGIQLSVEFEIDDNGYLDRACPFEDCATRFKVMHEDWLDIVRDEEVFCPLCRHDAEASDWNTPEQEEYLERTATAYIEKELDQAFKSDSRRFNRSQNRNSFIRMSMSYKPGHIPIPVPASAAEIMTQEVTCDNCSCRYSSIGATFFCPACGNNSILDTFANSISTVQKTLSQIPIIRAALTESENENIAEDSIRHICENSLVKIVSSFQYYSEACFKKLPNAQSFNVRRNLFQNLADSDAIWRNATGTGYTELLGDSEYHMLALYFQQRHVLVHLDGIVDQLYIDRSQDHRIGVGQRLKISESSVSDLAIVLEELAARLEALT